MLDIKDAVAVITGGASGIGLAVAKYWLQKGGKVVLGDIAEDALEQAAADMNGDVVTVVCNVTQEDDCAKLADTAIERFGQINLVAPFAGIIMDGLMLSPDRDTGKVTRKMSLEQFQRVVDINLTGVFLTIRECTERMINHNCRGLVCLVSSTGSLGTAGQINYSATKAAVSVMPKVLTAEFFRRGLGNMIRCVAIAPGYVATPILEGMNQKALEKILTNVPIGRLIATEEVASLVCELYQNEALAGDVFFIHGGLRLGSKG
ncbi:MAG: SDR family oxidoreductase [Desulfobacterales bacterium]|nr:MAG: SDR family oxidoreductase [Desulfobacterales bacterium]UCD88889.1 MAG: SDR family oxidoreductase [Desulfobacterales bacterium]